MPSFLYLTLLTVNMPCYSKKVPQCIFFLVLISFIGSEDMFSHKSNFHLYSEGSSCYRPLNGSQIGDDLC